MRTCDDAVMTGTPPADPQTVETPARLPNPGDVDWFLTAADRARAAKAQRMTVEAPTMWRAVCNEALQHVELPA